MNVLGDVHIASFKTVDDWQLFRPHLAPGGDQNLWEEALRRYFFPRLALRYLEPIKVIQEYGTFQVEGFSIVAIQCSLIEFLESTAQGLSYHYPRRGDQHGPYEYSDSNKLFVHFLTARPPFASDFNRQVAQDFYEGVRCGLLHEARPKHKWRIWGQGPNGTTIDAVRKIVYQNNLQTALLEFVDWYGRSLLADVRFQEAFIRKFDSLC